jgi:hypothetical protein
LSDARASIETAVAGLQNRATSLTLYAPEVLSNVRLSIRGSTMKLFPTTMSMLSVSLLGVLVAACSSKNEDGGGDTNGALGGASSSQGGTTSSNTAGGNATTGGKQTGNTSTTASSLGGSSVSNLPSACPGLPVTTTAVDAGTAINVDGGVQCAGVGVELEPSPLDMYVMMDRTDSMQRAISGTALTRWDVLQSGVQSFISDPGVLIKAPRVGLGFFGATGNPNDPKECDPTSYSTPQIEIEALATSGPKILAAVQKEASLLGGQTPWFPALQGSLMHAQDWQTANPNRMTIVVLVTDGYPTECNQDVAQIQEMVGEFYSGIAATYNTRGKPGIRTYVIGVAVDQFNLNAIAQAGGTNQATIVDGAAGVDQFVNAMVNITNANINCEIALPTPPSGKVVDPNAVQIVYTPYVGDAQEIPKASSAGGCGSANGGWYFDDPTDPKKITLCPCSCANLGAGGIQVRFGCRPRLVIG